MTITNTTILQLKFGEFKTSYHKTPHGEVVSFSLGKTHQTIPVVRIHSACLFGEAFLSKHCDCSEQLLNTLKLIKKHGSGVVVYGFQEGRGIGLDLKIRAMELQRTKHLDTVDAFKQLGLKPDLRDYNAMIDALDDLKIKKEIMVVSNNPEKIDAFIRAGYIIKKIIKLKVRLNKYNKDERLTKKNKLGYYID